MKKGKFNKTKEWLIEEYIVKNRSREEVAKECGLTIAGLKSLLLSLNIKKPKLTITKEVLEDLVDKRYTVEDIANYFKCSWSPVYKKLAEYGLKIKAEFARDSRYNDLNDNTIVYMYLDGFSTLEIAKQLNISHKTVYNHLIKNGIETRNSSEAQWASNGKTIPQEFSDYNTMYDLYITKNFSKKQLGIFFNCDPCVIDRILRNFNIPIRGASESKIGLKTGESHHNWKGGITALHMRLREAFGVQLVPKVLKRDGYRCQICGKSNNLHVHHIKPFKDILQEILMENPNYSLPKDINTLYEIAVKDPRFLDLDNLVTYCRNCHLYKVHKYNKKN